MSEQLEGKKVEVIYGPLLVNALFEGVERFFKREKKYEYHKIKLKQNDSISINENGMLITQKDVFIRDSQNKPKDNQNDLTDEDKRALKKMHFPKCNCSFLIPKSINFRSKDEENDFMELVRDIVYHECNSVSELYNRVTLFVMPFYNQQLHFKANAYDNLIHFSESNSAKDGQKSDDVTYATLIIALELQKNKDDYRLYAVDAIMLLSNSELLNFEKNQTNNPKDDEDKLGEKIKGLFHMRKSFIGTEEFENFMKIIHDNLAEFIIKLGAKEPIDTEKLVRAISEGNKNQTRSLYDLHDLQIGSVLLIFSSFIENINEDDLKRIYDDMRDDVRSNAFSSLLLSLDRWPSDDFIVETLEGFKVKLRPGYNALNDYRVGFEGREKNFYLSWNSLLILETKPDPDKKNAKNFLTFSLPRALIIEMLAGELLYLNSLYSELLKEFENFEEHAREARERAREIYVQTALTFDLGYIQVPLIRKVLEKIVETYGFKSTLDGIKSALSALDASTSAEATENLNVIILIVGLYAVLATLVLKVFPEYYWLLIVLFVLLSLVTLYIAIQLYKFRKKFKEIHYYLKKKRH
jgi:hypothetical protein